VAAVPEPALLPWLSAILLLARRRRGSGATV
jgi:hypothetical protein